jgi:hypothetical protein
VILKAKNITTGSHTYMSHFKGFGVFKTASQVTKLKNELDIVGEVVKVRAWGNPRKARESLTNQKVFIFDNMVILEKGDEEKMVKGTWKPKEQVKE